MGTKRIRKISMLLAVVLLGTMLFGNTASAAYWETVEVNAADLAVGDRVDAQYIVKPDGYVLTINGVQVSDKFAAAFPEGNTDYKYYEWWIDSYEKDDLNKTIAIMMNPVSDYMAVFVGGKRLVVKPGEKVTVTAIIPEEYKDSYIGFYEWRAWEKGKYKYIDLGLGEDELSKETITFVVPDLNPSYEWRSDFRGYMDVEYYYVLNSVSGNIIVGGDNKAFVDYVLPYDKENHSSDDQRVPAQGGSGTNEEAAKPVKNIVRTSNGDILTSTVDMLYGAASVTGVAVTTPKDTVDQVVGLSQEDMQNGIRTKFYIGNVYKPQVKQDLMEAAKELERTIFTMLDLDLYKIGKGGPKAVRDVLEPIEMIIEIPKSQIIEGRTFSLIGIIDGQYIELQDKDNDSNTITIDLNRFGAYALVYK